MLATDNWFKWGWYFTLTVESGTTYPSTELNWGRVESAFLLPQDRLYGGGVGLIQITSENFQLLHKIVKDGYDMSDFPSGRIKDDLVSGVKSLDWFKHSASAPNHQGGLFNKDETVEVIKMLESEQGIRSQVYYTNRYFFTNNKHYVNAIKDSNYDEKMKAFLVNIVVLRPASVTTLLNSNATSLNDLVNKTLSIPQLSGYTSRMNTIKNGLEMINISDSPPVDYDEIMNGTPQEPKEDNDIFIPIEDKVDENNEKIEDFLQNVLTHSIFMYNNDKMIGNNFIKVTKMMDNMYQVRFLEGFTTDIKDLIDKGKENIKDSYDDLTPTPPETPVEEEEEPTEDEFYFPVEYSRQGINFWVPPFDQTLKRNMDYGQRTTGDFHNGYDIGGGGRNHKVYAVKKGVVTQVGWVNGYGTIVQIKHDNDEYYSFYGHLVTGSPTVQKGDSVEAGDHIATMGNTGGNYAIHLHIEIQTTSKIPDHQNSINPREYLQVYGDNKTRLKKPTG